MNKVGARPARALSASATACAKLVCWAARSRTGRHFQHLRSRYGFYAGRSRDFQQRRDFAHMCALSQTSELFGRPSWRHAEHAHDTRKHEVHRPWLIELAHQQGAAFELPNGSEPAEVLVRNLDSAQRNHPSHASPRLAISELLVAIIGRQL